MPLFLSHLCTFLIFYSTVQSLIPADIRPVIQHAAHLSRRGCSDASDAFANFAFTTLDKARLDNETVLPDDLSFEEFSACEYLPQLQQVLFSTEEMDESVTYQSFVVIPEELQATLRDRFGEGVEINGPFVSSHIRILPNLCNGC